MPKKVPPAHAQQVFRACWGPLVPSWPVPTQQDDAGNWQLQCSSYPHPMLMAMPSPADDSNDKVDNGWDYNQPLLFTQPPPRDPPPPS